VRRLARNLIAARDLARFFRDWRPDVVVSNTLAVPSGAVGARLARVPHAWYVHELFGEENDLYFDLGVPLSLALMDRLSVRLVACSRAVRDQPGVDSRVEDSRRLLRASRCRRRPRPRSGTTACSASSWQRRAWPRPSARGRHSRLGMLAKRGVNARLELIGKSGPTTASPPNLARERDVLDRSTSGRLPTILTDTSRPPDVALMCSAARASGASPSRR
jgi:hypothetical protein